MKSTEGFSRAVPAHVPPDERFAQLREAFRVRLRHDGIKLMALGVAFARGTEDFASTFEQIRQLAHRMRGAAAIFDAPEILGASGVLEDAAVFAASARTPEATAAVCKALETLMTCLASASEPGASRPGLEARLALALPAG